MKHTEVEEPAARDGADDAHRLLERLVVRWESSLRNRPRRGRRDLSIRRSSARCCRGDAEWSAGIKELFAARPTATEAEITWQLIEELAVNGAEFLLPIFESRPKGVSDPDQPEFYRTPTGPRAGDPLCQARAEHAGEDSGDAAGIAPSRRRPRKGSTINATVSFHRSAGGRSCRGGGARAPSDARPVFGGHLADDAGLHDYVGRLDDWMTLRRQAGIGARRRATSTGPAWRHEEGVRNLQEPGYRSALSSLPTATTCTGPSSSAATSC